MPVLFPQLQDVPGTYPLQICCIPDSTDEYAQCSAAQGTGIVSGCAVTVSGMVATVASGVLAVNGVTYSYAGGTVNIAAASSGDRRDALIFRIVSSAATLVALEGTPCTVSQWTVSSTVDGPVKPDVVVTTDCVLREIAVPAGTNSLTLAGNVVDKSAAPVLTSLLATTAALTTETTRATAAEGTLTTGVSTNATAISAETTRATAAEALAAQKSANLGDLASASTARTNLGLGTAATQPSSAFDASGAAAAAQTAAITAAEAASNQRASNLSDVADAGSSRFNISAPVLSAVAAVATANVSLSAPGATLDGYTLQANDEVLLTAQSTPSQNGVWIWSGASSALVRPNEFPTGGLVKRGRTLAVVNGTVNGNTEWILSSTAAGITIDTTSQTWTRAGTGTYVPLTSVTAGFNGAYYMPLPSGDATGATDSAAWNACQTALGGQAAGNGNIAFRYGTYNFNSSANPVQTNKIGAVGPGSALCQINIVGNNTGLTFTNTSFASVAQSAPIFGFTVDGGLSGSKNAWGIQIGDRNSQYINDVICQNFNTGERLDNSGVTVTSGSATVADTSIVTADNGKLVTGVGMPSPCYVGTVTNGVSFLLSSSPTSQVNVNAVANSTYVVVGGGTGVWFNNQNGGWMERGNVSIESNTATAAYVFSNGSFDYGTWNLKGQVSDNEILLTTCSGSKLQGEVLNLSGNCLTQTTANVGICWYNPGGGVHGQWTINVEAGYLTGNTGTAHQTMWTAANSNIQGVFEMDFVQSAAGLPWVMSNFATNVPNLNGSFYYSGNFSGASDATFCNGVSFFGATTGVLPSSNLIAVGEETIDRRYPTTSTSTPTASVAYFTFFTCRKTETKGHIVLTIGGTAASGLTAAYVGLYSFDGTSALTRIAVSADIHTSLTSTFSSPSLAISTVGLKAGTQYAAAMVFVGTTPPQLTAGFGVGNRCLVLPPVCGQLAAQTTLPSSTTLGALGASSPYYMEITP